MSEFREVGLSKMELNMLNIISKSETNNLKYQLASLRWRRQLAGSEPYPLYDKWIAEVEAELKRRNEPYNSGI